MSDIDELIKDFLSKNKSKEYCKLISEGYEYAFYVPSEGLKILINFRHIKENSINLNKTICITSLELMAFVYNSKK